MNQPAGAITLQTRSIEEFRGMIGATLGVSPWYPVTKADIGIFADVTKDHQFIHVDEDRATAGPFGGIIAHGMFTLSLVSAMFEQAVGPLDGVATNVNYGFDKVRFLSPVPAGSEICGTFTLSGIEERAKGQFLFRYSVTMNIKGVTKPALIAEWLVMHIVD